MIAEWRTLWNCIFVFYFLQFISFGKCYLTVVSCCIGNNNFYYHRMRCTLFEYIRDNIQFTVFFFYIGLDSIYNWEYYWFCICYLNLQFYYNTSIHLFIISFFATDNIQLLFEQLWACNIQKYSVFFVKNNQYFLCLKYVLDYYS